MRQLRSTLYDNLSHVLYIISVTLFCSLLCLSCFTRPSKAFAFLSFSAYIWLRLVQRFTVYRPFASQLRHSPDLKSNNNLSLPISQKTNTACTSAKLAANFPLCILADLLSRHTSLLTYALLFLSCFYDLSKRPCTPVWSYTSYSR